MDSKGGIMKKENPKLSKTYLILKIIGGLLLATGILLFILSFVIFNQSGEEASRMGMRFGGTCAFIIGIFITFCGFMPNISKLNVKTTKYIMNQNQDDLTDISTMQGEISAKGTPKVAQAIKEVFDKDGEGKTKYCKYCGKEIDYDAIYCDRCGKKQE